MSKLYAGIDVAKAHLDVALGPNSERFAVANDERGISALLERLEPADMVIIEATRSEMVNAGHGTRLWSA